MSAQRVYKYQLPMGDWAVLHMPEGAEPLCVQVQHGVPCLWARVTDGAPTTERQFRIAGTGHYLSGRVGKHIGSFQMEGGALVFHVFAEAGQ